MSEVVVATFWCYGCSQIVNPIVEAEIKCPLCDSGFVEDIRINNHNQPLLPISDEGMVSSNSEVNEYHGENYVGMLESLVLRQRNLQLRHIFVSRLLQLLQVRLNTQSPHFEIAGESNASDSGRNGDRIVLIHLRIHGSHEFINQNSGPNYFTEREFELLLQHLAESDPNRYGTPPASKDAVDAMPIVKIHEELQCTVCLDDFEIGAEAKEMLCGHKFHEQCILPWLELHSSCPICRSQMPTQEESKLDFEVHGGEESNGSESSRDGRRFSLLGAINSLLYSFGIHTGGGNGSSSSSSSSENSASNLSSSP